METPSEEEGRYEHGDLDAFRDPAFVAITSIIAAVTEAHTAATDPNVRHFLHEAQKALREARFSQFTASLATEAARELFLRTDDDEGTRA